MKTTNINKGFTIQAWSSTRGHLFEARLRGYKRPEAERQIRSIYLDFDLLELIASENTEYCTLTAKRLLE